MKGVVMAVQDMISSMHSEAKLSTWGASRAVRIPKGICEVTGIDAGDSLEMITGTDDSGPFIIIRPASNHRSYGNVPCVPMDKLFSDYRGDYSPTEEMWGDDQGAEVVE